MTIRDEILKLVNVAPQEIGEEEEIQTAVVENFTQELNDEQVDTNEQRIKGFIDLAQVDKSYHGRVVSRSKQNDEDFTEFFEAPDENEEMSEDDYGSDEESDDDQKEELEDVIPAKKLKISKKKDVSDDGESNEDDYIQLVSNKNDELSKAKAVKTQIKLWDNLMKYRINFQNFLTKVNEYPRFDELSHFENEDNKENLEKLRQNTLSLFNGITNIKIEMNKMLSGAKNDESSEESSEKASLIFDDKNVEFKLKSMNEHLEKDYQNTLNDRNSIIQKWYDKTYLTSGKSSGMKELEKPVLKQLEYVLMDKKRIVKRTQLKRTIYNTITKTPHEEEKQNDEEIFDDLDFYHQFLRELVNLKDDGNLAQKSIQLSKLNMAKKKKTHTKASKGRKLKFDTHKPLVNFMAPIYKSQMTEEAKNDLFSSLFQSHPIYNLI